MISAVLDACVLFSASLRDILLRLAEDKLVDPFWSAEIRDEWIRSLLRKRPKLKREKLERTCREMDSFFPGSLVDGYESITPTLTLPDLNDRHVLAVAIRAKAEYIVTFNLSDFPEKDLQPYHIEALSPDDFIFRVIQKSPHFFLQTVKRHRSDLKNPPKTVEEYLATLEQQGLPKTVAFLRKHEADI